MAEISGGSLHEPHSGMGSASSSGVGSAPSSGVGSAPSSGVGSAPSSGVGSAPSSGVGSAPHFGARQRSVLQERGAAGIFSDIPSAPADEDLNRLRALLLGRESALVEKLAALQEEKRHTTNRVSEVLAEAVIQRSGKDHTLTLALEPLVDDIVKNSFRKRQAEFAGVLGPLMGPSIRKSIAESFRHMLEGFSKTVEMAFSWQGLRWRFEAWRSGRSFSEIVLLHTLIYRVEQVFFIHGETGLVLEHVQAEDAGAQDADMVSAMLTAIQDFVKDCFTTGSSDELESLRMGDFTIQIEKAPSAYLACVVRGTPPEAFRTRLRETLELMLAEYADALESFSGDVAPFAGASRYLEACMAARYAGEGNILPFWARALPIALLFAVAGCIGWVQYVRFEREEAVEEGVQALRNEPGIMVVNVADPHQQRCEVILLKDRISPEPAEVVKKVGIDPAIFSFKATPFVSHDAAIVEARARQLITLPEEVSMVYDGNGTLSFSGTASTAWILNARDQAWAIPGVEHVDTSGMHDPLRDKIRDIVKEVESLSIEFPVNKDIPVPADIPKLERVVALLADLSAMATKNELVVSLTVFGHADATGSVLRNYEISRARARTVAAALYAKGASIPVTLYGFGSEHPKNGNTVDNSSASAPSAAPGASPGTETGNTPGGGSVKGGPAAKGTEKGARIPAGSAVSSLSKSDQSSRRIELRVHLARLASTNMDLTGSVRPE